MFVKANHSQTVWINTYHYHSEPLISDLGQLVRCYAEGSVTHAGPKGFVNGNGGGFYTSLYKPLSAWEPGIEPGTNQL